MTDRIIAFITACERVAGALFGGVLDFIDRRMIVRRAIILVVLWQLIDVYIWAKGYAMTPGRTGVELAAALSALTIPVTALMGFLTKLYGDFREGADK